MLRRFALLIAKPYAAIGGQAVIEGVMMRSPNAFVIAVRKPDGGIRLRKDQWYGLGRRVALFKKPLFRGVLVLLETLANGVVSLNYSANIALVDDEKKASDKVDFSTFVSMAISIVLGLAVFVMLPHGLTAWLESSSGRVWGLQSFEFHFIDGVIKGIIFLSYVALIGLLPDIRRVFQYHGAEHKSISTFEAGEELTVENARKHSTFHPRCGTTFVFFLLFLSIVLFAAFFAVIKMPEGLPFLAQHAMAIVLKIVLTLPVAGISYEVLKWLGNHTDGPIGVMASAPGKLLQKLTTREPDDAQLEVALSSIKAVLSLEEKHELRKASGRILTAMEIDVSTANDIANSNLKLKDFLD